MASKDQELARAYVTIAADLNQYEAALNALPAKSAQKIDATMRAIKARMASTRLELNAAYKAGDLAEYTRLSQVLDNLKVKHAAVENAVRKQAQAARDAAVVMVREYERAQIAAAHAQGAAEGLAAANRRAAAGASGMGSALGSSSGGAMRSTMALMALSSAIDDAQYGFRGVVNNLPFMAGLFTENAEKAMKLGAAFQLAGVAINIWINNWDEAKKLFGSFGGDTAGILDWFAELGDRALSAGASVSEFVLSLGGIRGVSFSAADLAAAGQQRAEQAARTKRAGKAAETLGGIGAEGTSERAAAFREAIAQFGGGEALNRAIEAKVDALGGSDEMKGRRRESILDTLGRALRGDRSAIAAATSGPLGNAQLGSFYAKNSPEAKAREKAEREELRRIGEEREEMDRLKEEAAELDRRDAEKAAQERDREADRLAKNLQGPVGKRLLADDRTNVDNDVRARLGRAGVQADNAMVFQVAGKIREAIDQAVRERALAGGLTDEQARAELLKEQRKQEKDDAESREKEGRGPERQMGMTEGVQNIVKNMQVQALKQFDNTPREQLKTLNESKKFLGDILVALKEKRESVARFRK